MTTGLIRDTGTSAVLNTDVVGYQKFLQEQKRSREFADTVKKVDVLHQEMGQIKQMLQTIINGLNNNGQERS